MFGSGVSVPGSGEILSLVTSAATEEDFLNGLLTHRTLSQSCTPPGTIRNNGCGAGIFFGKRSRCFFGSRFFNFRFKCRHS